MFVKTKQFLFNKSPLSVTISNCFKMLKFNVKHVDRLKICQAIYTVD